MNRYSVELGINWGFFKHAVRRAVKKIFSSCSTNKGEKKNFLQYLFNEKGITVLLYEEDMITQGVTILFPDILRKEVRHWHLHPTGFLIRQLIKNITKEAQYTFADACQHVENHIVAWEARVEWERSLWINRDQ